MQPQSAAADGTNSDCSRCCGRGSLNVVAPAPGSNVAVGQKERRLAYALCQTLYRGPGERGRSLHEIRSSGLADCLSSIVYRLSSPDEPIQLRALLLRCCEHLLHDGP